MSNMFREDMTPEEAWKTLYTAIKRDTPKEERDRIMEEYKKVVPAIVKKELSGPPAMTSYRI